MKLTDYIRKHLTGAAEPQTSAEIAEEIGSTSNEVSKALFAMVRAGEALKTKVEGSHPSYSLNAKHEPKRGGRKAATKVKAPKATRKAKPVRAKGGPKRRKQASTPPPRSLEQAGAPTQRSSDCTLPRHLVRTLIGFILSSPLYLDGEVRAAIVQAVQEAA